MNNLIDQSDDRGFTGQILQVLNKVIITLPGKRIIRQFFAIVFALLGV